MAGCVLGSDTNFIRQGGDLRGRGARGDMKPTREDFVAGEGTTDGVHGGSVLSRLAAAIAGRVTKKDRNSIRKWSK